MRNTFFPVKKPVKLGRVTLFLIFDALVPIFPPKVSAQVQVHPNLKTIFWGFKNPKKSALPCRPGQRSGIVTPPMQLFRGNAIPALKRARWNKLMHAVRKKCLRTTRSRLKASQKRSTFLLKCTNSRKWRDLEVSNGGVSGIW